MKNKIESLFALLLGKFNRADFKKISCWACIFFLGIGSTDAMLLQKKSKLIFSLDSIPGTENSRSIINGLVAESGFRNFSASAGFFRSFAPGLELGGIASFLSSRTNSTVGTSISAQSEADFALMASLRHYSRRFEGHTIFPYYEINFGFIIGFHTQASVGLQTVSTEDMPTALGGKLRLGTALNLTSSWVLNPHIGYAHYGQLGNINYNGFEAGIEVGWMFGSAGSKKKEPNDSPDAP